MRCYQLCLLVSLHTQGLRVLEPSNGTLLTAPLVARAETHRRLSVEYLEAAKLVASDAAWHDNFGYSVAIDGNTVVIGTEGADAVYVLRTTDGGATYGQVAKLTANDVQRYADFGISVAIDGSTIVAGAYEDDAADDDAGWRSGSVYVFLKTDGGGYDQVAKLTASDAAASDKFGWSVAIDGGTVR